MSDTEKKLKFKLIVLLLGAVFALVVFELILRIFQPQPENLTKLKSSAVFLYENKPNAEFGHGDKLGEFWVPIKYNSFGFRDSEFDLDKNEETYRIAVLGDSFEEALQVELNYTWPKVMAQKLSNRTGRKVETYNFAVSGYGTDQQWLTLREKVWQFQPDMIIVAFTPNDVGDTYKNNLVRRNGDGVEIVSAAERAGGNFLGKIVRQTYTYHLLFKVSSVNKYSSSFLKYLRTKILGFPNDERFYLSDAQLVEGPFEVVASQENPPAEVRKGWKLVEALLADIKRQTAKRGVQLVLTISVPPVQVEPQTWEELREQYGLDPETSSPTVINDTLEALASKLDINFYDPVLDAIEWSNDRGVLYFGKDHHFNINGHKFMGESVAEYLMENKIIE